MTIGKLIWLTDIHLNFLEKESRENFYSKVEKIGADAVLITGDIAEARDICQLLKEFVFCVNKPIYFVLGNHDYYFGSVKSVREAILELCLNDKNLHWLGRSEIVILKNETVLVGHDGWADARYGNFEQTTVNLNDSRFITELFQAQVLGRHVLKKEMQRLADFDVAILKETLEDAVQKFNPKKIIIATHVPPFKECCWYNGRQSDENWQPYFSSKIFGDMISAIVKKYSKIDFLVLCGHTHTEYVIKPFENLEVKVGGAQYYQPKIQEIIEC